MSAIPVDLPLYRCHKIVQAAKITDLVCVGATNQCFVFVEIPNAGETLRIPVTAEWLQRFKPEVGGYYVRYEDGYSSYSPAKAFEDGYTSMLEVLPQFNATDIDAVHNQYDEIAQSARDEFLARKPNSKRGGK